MRGRSEHGSAVVDFVLVLVVLLPLVLGILHLALVLHVRTTLTSAATEGARYAATVDRSAASGVQRTRREIGQALAERFAERVSTRVVDVGGVPAVEVRVKADVPPLGIWGPATHLEVVGRALEEPSGG